MAVLSVQVEGVSEDVLRAVDGELIIDSTGMADVIRCALYSLHRAMSDVVEGFGEIDAGQLRSFADRLGRLAALAEEVA